MRPLEYPECPITSTTRICFNEAPAQATGEIALLQFEDAWDCDNPLASMRPTARSIAQLDWNSIRCPSGPVHLSRGLDPVQQLVDGHELIGRDDACPDLLLKILHGNLHERVREHRVRR